MESVERANVALATGHLFRAPEMDSTAQERAGQAIRLQTAEILRRRRVGQVFAALACGSDIVVAEAALDAGLPLHIVLPFALDRFAAHSIDVGDPPGRRGSWRARADALAARAASMSVAEAPPPGDGEVDGYFHHGFRLMAGMALMRAETLGWGCRLIAITDGRPAAGIAGANRAAADWRAAGHAVDDVPFPAGRAAASARAGSESSFRPVVLLFGPSGGADRSALEFASGGRAVRAMVADTVNHALSLAAIGAREAPAVCSFGPVLDPGGAPNRERIAGMAEAAARQTGESDGAGLLATIAFAAEAVFDSPGFLRRLDSVDLAATSTGATGRLFRVRPAASGHRTIAESEGGSCSSGARAPIFPMRRTDSAQ